MKKLLLLVLCLVMAACGYLYYQETLALSAQEQAPADQGIEQTFCDRNGHAVGDITLFPAVYQHFDPAADKVDGFWNEARITGARDYVLRVTNEGATACYFRTYVAFENTNGVFDELITINWGEGFTAAPIEGDLILADDAEKVSKYRVYLVTTTDTLAPGAMAEPMLQLFLGSEADNADVQAIGEHYTIRAATEAVWLPAEDSPDYPEIGLFTYNRLDDLLGAKPTLEHARELFAPNNE